MDHPSQHTTQSKFTIKRYFKLRLFSIFPRKGIQLEALYRKKLNKRAGNLKEHKDPP